MTRATIGRCIGSTVVGGPGWRPYTPGVPVPGTLGRTSDDQATANRRRCVVLATALGAVLAVVALGLNALVGGGAVGIVAGLVLSAVVVGVAWFRSDAVVLAMSHALPADPVVHARLHNLVEGLCIAAGLPKPGVYVVEDDALNSFATGRNARHASVAVTTGLLEMLTRVELEGVLAHELSHVRNHDIASSTLAATTVGLPFLLFGPLAGRLIRLTVGRRREALADVAGVSLTRYPPGLIAALEKLRDDPSALHSRSAATDHLWITHPPIEERLEALREL